MTATIQGTITIEQIIPALTAQGFTEDTAGGNTRGDVWNGTAPNGESIVVVASNGNVSVVSRSLWRHDETRLHSQSPFSQVFRYPTCDLVTVQEGQGKDSPGTYQVAAFIAGYLNNPPVDRTATAAPDNDPDSLANVPF